MLLTCIWRIIQSQQLNEPMVIVAVVIPILLLLHLLRHWIIGPIEQWKVERIRDFGNLFNADRNNNVAGNVQVDLSRWETSNADSMIEMFVKATQINLDVSLWDTTKYYFQSGPIQWDV
jgi:Mycoplasma protein of unknown function, DUF285